MTNLASAASDYVADGGRPYSDAPNLLSERKNLPPEMEDVNLFTGDQLLVSAVEREGIEWVKPAAIEAGAITGSRKFRAIAKQANHRTPKLQQFDESGRRIDFVEYHPAYHEIMRGTYTSGVHSLPWTTNHPRPQLARSILYYMWNQVENGVISCPNGMSFAIAPLLQSDPEIGNRWLTKVLSNDYDPRALPGSKKSALTVGMAMTESQGGSDVRANTTVARPTGEPREYILNGHKFFVSAPMSDLLLLTAKTETGVSLFIAPRILENGARNNLFIQRLKNKMGNNSNATSEMELKDAIGYRIGEDGRGIRYFVKFMTHYIRMALSLGSAGIMRKALTEAIHYTSHRQAFGTKVSDFPMMQNTLADMAIESEAATLLGLRVAKSVDDGATEEVEEHLSRILIPIAKYWNCRRASAVTLEALECHGGMGYIEDHSIARFHREAPLNSIWEGTSAVMGLDVMRTLNTFPGALDALVAEINLAQGLNSHFDRFVRSLESDLLACQ